MNESEMARSRWSRLEGVLRAEVGGSTHELERVLAEIVAKMRAADEAAGAPAGRPDPELVEQAIRLATRKRMLLDVVLPAFEKLERSAIYQPNPLEMMVSRQR